MKKGKVLGLGGVFFKTPNPKATRDWYKNNLGFDTNDYGCTFSSTDENGEKATIQWSPFEEKTDYFNPSKKDFMFNYRVENLVELLAELKEKGVKIIDKIEEYDYGKFGWIIDLDGNKIELWEPK